MKWIVDRLESEEQAQWRACPACEMPLRFVEYLIPEKKTRRRDGTWKVTRLKSDEFPYCSRHGRVSWWVIWKRGFGVIGRANKRGGRLYSRLDFILRWVQRRGKPWVRRWEQELARNKPRAARVHTSGARQLGLEFEPIKIGEKSR